MGFPRRGEPYVRPLAFRMDHRRRPGRRLRPGQPRPSRLRRSRRARTGPALRQRLGHRTCLRLAAPALAPGRRQCQRRVGLPRQFTAGKPLPGGFPQAGKRPAGLGQPGAGLRQPGVHRGARPSARPHGLRTGPVRPGPGRPGTDRREGRVPAWQPRPPVAARRLPARPQRRVGRLAQPLRLQRQRGLRTHLPQSRLLHLAMPARRRARAGRYRPLPLLPTGRTPVPVRLAREDRADPRRAADRPGSRAHRRQDLRLPGRRLRHPG